MFQGQLCIVKLQYFKYACSCLEILLNLDFSPTGSKKGEIYANFLQKMEKQEVTYFFWIIINYLKLDLVF